MPAFPPPTLPNWQRAVSGSRPRGTIRQAPEDFVVIEQLGFEPDDTGEHDFIWLEKRDANTTWVARQLAAHAGVPARDTGFGGMKDRHAVTRQWFSVRRPTGAGTDWSGLELPGVTILDVRRNSRKLRRGANAGNAFRIVVALAEAVGDTALEFVRTRGVPNYFGEQRFGIDGNNLSLVAAWTTGERLDRTRRALAISTARAWLFNGVLAGRVADGTWDHILSDDLVMLDARNSTFAADDDPSLARRAVDLELHPSGPLWGRAAGPLQAPRARESALAADYPALVSALEKHATADRRPLRAAVRNFTWTADERGIVLEFFLAAGCYATAVLRELVDVHNARDQSASSNT